VLRGREYIDTILVLIVYMVRAALAGKKQSPEQVAARVASFKATMLAKKSANVSTPLFSP
jgi:hypothetical protein